MALSSSVLFAMFFGMFEMSMASYTYHYVSDAAREGSRYAVVRGQPPAITLGLTGCGATSDTISTYVKDLPYPGINPSIHDGYHDLVYAERGHAYDVDSVLDRNVQCSGVPGEGECVICVSAFGALHTGADNQRDKHIADGDLTVVPAILHFRVGNSLEKIRKARAGYSRGFSFCCDSPHLGAAIHKP